MYMFKGMAIGLVTYFAGVGAGYLAFHKAAPANDGVPQITNVYIQDGTSKNDCVTMGPSTLSIDWNAMRVDGAKTVKLCGSQESCK